MPARAIPTISSLEIYTDEGQVIGDNKRLASTSTRYIEVERCIHLALRILESPDGIDSLSKTAIFIIEESRERKKPTLYQGSFADMPKWITFFLTKMRSSFPMTYLSHMEGEALACRQANDIKALKDFSPKHIGYMDVNRYIVNNIIAAEQRGDTKNLKLFRFEMSISIAHEIVHFLTGFLNGEKADKMFTPPEVGARGYTTGKRGEAGRYWEELLLGGQTELWQNAADPAGVHQAGIPYLFVDGTGKSKARIINTAYIDNFIAGGKFTSPLKLSRVFHSTLRPKGDDPKFTHTVLTSA